MRKARVLGILGILGILRKCAEDSDSLREDTGGSMKIFKYNGQGGIDHDESQLTRLSASVSNGYATITRRVYFEADAANEDAIDILSLPEFPQKYSAHPMHAGFRYYGNAQIEPLSEGSKIWKADIEYTAIDPNATDSGGGAITSETPPWQLRPDDIQFSYPEVVVPFDMSYNELGEDTTEEDDEEATVPVRNAAGDLITMERSVRLVQMSFTFFTKKWDANNNLEYGNTINAEDIEVCGLKIPKHKGLLLPPECTYLTVYKDNSNVIKWQYWSVTINIQVDTRGLVLYRKVLNVGDRARGAQISLSDDDLLNEARKEDETLPKTLPSHNNISQICHFRLMKKAGSKGENSNEEDDPPEEDEPEEGAGKDTYLPFGRLCYCTWQQYLEARELYLKASQILIEKKKLDEPYELTCEQDTQMPLDRSGYIYGAAIPGHPDYKAENYLTLRFREYPVKSWKSLNLPKTGFKTKGAKG